MDVTGIITSPAAMNNAAYSMAASIKVMDMAENVNEQVMNELLDSLNGLISGLGESIDVTV